MALLRSQIGTFNSRENSIIYIKRYSLWGVKSAKIGIYNTELRKNDDRVGIQ